MGIDLLLQGLQSLQAACTLCLCILKSLLTCQQLLLQGQT